MGLREMTTMSHTLSAWYPLLHLALYQVVWLVVIIGGANLMVWPGVLAAGIMLLVHVAFSAQRLLTLGRLFQATVVGLIVDTVLASAGALSFTGCSCVVPPLWMLVLWPAFASLFDDLLRWVPERPLVAVLLGAIGGPLAYLGGDALGAVAFPWGTGVGLGAVAVAWALATWVLVVIWRTPRTAAPVVEAA
jgi:hypothetical protein